MKKPFTKMAWAAFVVAGLFATVSCEKNQEEATPASQPALSDEVKARFRGLGFDVSDLTKVGENYLVEGDIIVTPQALANMAEPVVVNGPKGEQYRTYNLVGAPRTIRVRGSNLTTKLSNALNSAIANYNNEGLGITFQRVSSGGDIVVTRSGSGAGGVAGFPYGDGRPYNSVTIYGGMDNYSSDVCEHVITHELGHCVGLRHSDWFNRSYSCGSGGSEGAGNDGAIQIPGTPSQYDPNSIMNACFGSSETGEFSNYDKTALNYLY